MSMGASHLLSEARRQEESGAIAAAMSRYGAAIAAASDDQELAVLAEALRRLAVVLHQRDETGRAWELCRQSYQVACELGSDVLAAEAMNTLGGLHLSSGALEEARRSFLKAIRLGSPSRQLRARAEQNLGILANIQGDLEEALTWYQRSLEAYRECGDDHGRAIAYHNLGMVSHDAGAAPYAEKYFHHALELADRTGDVFLQGICLVSRAELEVGRQRFENARELAEDALARFEKIGAGGAKADAYRVLGMMYRESGRPVQAEARLRTAVALSSASQSALNEAESLHELALLYQSTGRDQPALRTLHAAYGLFRKLQARPELVRVGGKVAEIETAYREVVRNWGRSIECSDARTFGHCERVAQNAVATARELKLGEELETTILLGGYLHDVGKIRIPPEVLTKNGPLTSEEQAVVRMHPLWGVDLLANIEFPWDIQGIVRWHHERIDGTGYPDRLAGDAIPIGAQIVGLWDDYDTLTVTRDPAAALSPRAAIGELQRRREGWSPRVFEAFLKVWQSSVAELP
ncbi:MAG TPA: HD domain-containing phosphohydrolase [Gemmatimonadales bacterium]|nr:HD domain-containing phosphohydrolase [Gemmatimonadales bacterium]